MENFYLDHLKDRYEYKVSSRCYYPCNGDHYYLGEKDFLKNLWLDERDKEAETCEIKYRECNYVKFVLSIDFEPVVFNVPGCLYDLWKWEKMNGWRSPERQMLDAVYFKFIANKYNVTKGSIKDLKHDHHAEYRHMNTETEFYECVYISSSYYYFRKVGIKQLVNAEKMIEERGKILDSNLKDGSEWQYFRDLCDVNIANLKEGKWVSKRFEGNSFTLSDNEFIIDKLNKFSKR